MPTTIVISETQFTDCNFLGSTAKLRRYYDSDFVDIDGIEHFAGSVGSSTGFFDEVDGTLVDHVLTFPSFNATPTINAQIGTPRENWQLWDEAGTAFPNLVAENIFIPTEPSPITLGNLLIANKGQTLDNPPLTYITLWDVLRLIANTVGTLLRATTVIFGLVRLSVAAADVTDPKVVGDNDPRVPTQGENDALQGTSGTPSNTNRYITQADPNRGLMDSVATADLPVAGTAGRLRRITDLIHGFVFDTGTKWINALQGNICIEEYATLAAMISDIGSTQRTVYVPNSFACANNATIPSNITLKFTGQGSLALTTGVTVTIQGPLLAPRRRIFTNALATQGTISFSGNQSVEFAYPEWWAVNTTPGTTDMAPAINAANAALITLGSGEISLGPGTYAHTELTLGTSAAFTGVSLRGTNGLAGTVLRYLGTGDALTVLKGRFVRLRDFLLVKSNSTKGASRGIVLTGTSGTGADTFYTEIERVTVGNTSQGFNVGFINGNGTNGFDADLTIVRHSVFQYNNIGVEITGQNSTQIKFDHVSLESNLIYGAYNNGAATQVDWNGGAWGRNALGFFNHTNNANITIAHIRDELGTDVNYRLYYSDITSGGSNVSIEDYQPAGTVVLTKPLIYGLVDDITIRDSNFVYTTAHWIPYGSYDNEGTGGGTKQTVRMINNTVNENVPLIGINTIQSTQDGLTYVLEGNKKVSDVGTETGYFPNRRGIMVWPNLVDADAFTPNATPANSTHDLAFLNIVAGQKRTAAQISANQNNYNPGGQGFIQRWSSDASRNVTGLIFTTAQIGGEFHRIVNVGSFDIVLQHQSASSTAANRFLSPTGADVIIPANGSAGIEYDDVVSRWRIVGVIPVLNSVITPAQIAANTDNYNPGIAYEYRLSTDASRNITGIAVSQVSAEQHLIINVGSFNIVLVNDATSTAANRFLTNTAADITLGPKEMVLIVYDVTVSRWRAAKWQTAFTDLTGRLAQGQIPTGGSSGQSLITDGAGTGSFATRLRVAYAKYSFAVDGGAQGTITPAITTNIPDNAIILGQLGQINSTTAANSGGAATIAIGTSAGSSTTSIKGATAFASFSADALLTTVTAPFKMTAAGNVTFTIGAADLNAGIIEAWIFYMVAAA